MILNDFLIRTVLCFYIISVGYYIVVDSIFEMYVAGMVLLIL